MKSVISELYKVLQEDTLVYEFEVILKDSDIFSLKSYFNNYDIPVMIYDLPSNKYLIRIKNVNNKPSVQTLVVNKLTHYIPELEGSPSKLKDYITKKPFYQTNLILK